MFGGFFKSIARRVLAGLLMRAGRIAPDAGRKLGILLRDALPVGEMEVAALLRSAAAELETEPAQSSRRDIARYDP